MQRSVKDESRKRSIDNLQRVFTIVVSLSITEALRRVVSDARPNVTALPLSEALAVVALIFTIIPFYHGANRYLDATYVTGQRQAKSQALMLDFVAIFIEGMIFFVLSLLIQEIQYFYTLLAFLFIYDAGWVGLTRLTSREPPGSQPPYIQWAFVNVLAAALLLLSHWSNLLNWEFWVSDDVTAIASCFIAIGRTIYDYSSVWEFYYPPPPNEEYVMPVPRPAKPTTRTQKR